MTQNIDGARLTLMLNDLRLPAIKQDWSGFAERADRESWPAARFLATLAEHEIAERDRRRLARHLAEAQLLPGKTLDSFDFNVVPMISKAPSTVIDGAPHSSGKPSAPDDRKATRQSTTSTLCGSPTIKPTFSSCQRQLYRTLSCRCDHEFLTLIAVLSHPDCRAITARMW